MHKSIGKSVLSLFSLIIFFSLISCSQSRVAYVQLTSIEISPLITGVSLGTETQLSATAFYDDGNRQNTTSEVEWSSSDTRVLSISSTGKLKPLAPGSSTITATLDSITTSVELTVNAAELLSLNINPANPEIYVNTQTKLSVFGRYNDGTKAELTDNVSWTHESDTYFTRNKNVVTGSQAGSASITASFSGKTATTQITVNDAALRSIVFDLDSATFYAGNNIKLQATGVYADGNKQDISQLVNWAYSAQPASLGVSLNNNALSVDADGQLTVTASLGDISSSKIITINPASLQSIEVSSSRSNLAAGEKLQLQAQAYYSNGKTADITGTVIWSSSDKTILEVSNALGIEGQAISKQVGAITASATLGNYSGSIDINVSPASLNSIDITLRGQSIAKGTSLPLIATGIYSDNSARDITTSVTWFSADTNIIHVNNQLEKAGLASGINPGTTQVKATSGSITSSAEVTVTEATLVDIYIDNLSAEVIIDTSLPLQAIGIFSDGTTQVLTDQVVWRSSDTGVTSVSNNEANPGELNAITTGSSTISVTFNNITVTGVIEVNDATLTGITILPNTLSLTEGTSSQLQAVGTLSNGNTQDVSDMVIWESNAADIVSVSNADNEKGLIYSKQSGEAVISVRAGERSASSTITVNTAALVSIEVSYQNTSIANGTKLTLTATGIYDNNSTQDITSDVLWQSNSPDIASVYNSENKEGFVYALSQGSASITATMAGVTGSTNITVTPKTLDGIGILFDGNSTLAAGNEIQLRAIGNYSDGSTLDISNQVTWQSSDNTICTVSTSETNYGLLKAKKTGACNVTAKLGKFNTAIFSITDATLQSISITPDNVLLPKGSDVQLIAIGTYSDNTTSDISNQVNWKANDAFISISNENNSSGLLHAIDVGESTITANYNGVSATSNVTVSAATLTDITIAAVVSGDFNLGTIKSYVATGTYSNSTTRDISDQVLWVSSNTDVATVSNAIDTIGQLTSMSAGAMTLNATLNDITSNSLNINIIDAPQAPVSLSMRATPYIILNDDTDTADIVLNIQAADNTATIADGTKVQLDIIIGSGNLSSSTVTTVNGSAEFKLSSLSLTKGLMTIKATVTGTEISNFVSVYATDDFAKVIARYGFASGSLEGGLVPAGTKLGFLILNYANRPFTIDRYEVYNDETIVADASDLGILPGGSNMLVTYTATETLSNTYVVIYYLREEKTSFELSIAAGFTLQ